MIWVRSIRKWSWKKWTRFWRISSISTLQMVHWIIRSRLNQVLILAIIWPTSKGSLMLWLSNCSSLKISSFRNWMPILKNRSSSRIILWKIWWGTLKICRHLVILTEITVRQTNVKVVLIEITLLKIKMISV